MDLKKVFLVGTVAFVIVSLALFYFLINSTNLTGKSQHEVNMARMESKLQTLEEEFKSHKISMKELEENIVLDKFVGLTVSNTCSASVGIPGRASSDINMLDVYELMKFDNPDGGVWKQGWELEVASSRFTSSNPLHVFVIPHSHNDPGWLKTFERYFEDQTKGILHNMLKALVSEPKTKFIWAEISYFNLWWRGLSRGEKEQVQEVVRRGQLEFVSGGWVMPDEANSHFYSILLQLTEGHQWLQNHLNYTPKNGWSIDPFGLSPTLAYILKRSGLENMLIQRTHYSVKKHFAKLQQLEFKWRQLWDSAGTTDMMTHMMPFYSYDIPHTCGPNPKICCQFDFKRMHGVSSMSCPWNIAPQPIINQNLRERSTTLLDQYKKKASLYKSNVLLVPLGDDFRWDDKAEWDAQVNNYNKIFDYINSSPELHAKVGFGTLGDYFDALGEKVEGGEFTPKSLSGDFFTYADRDDNYWSGYYTSRPYHKGMDRELLAHLTSAQILFTQMVSKVGPASQPFLRSLLGKLRAARRNLSLFQHHDGVTGTSKDHVMVDYAQKLHSGLAACSHVMGKSLEVLSTTSVKKPLPALFDEDSTPKYISLFTQEHHHSLPKPRTIHLDRDNRDKLVTLFNPSAHSRTQLASFHVSTPYVKLVELEGEEVEIELHPVWKGKTEISTSSFEVQFLAKIDPLGVKHYIVKYEEGGKLNGRQPEIVVVNPASDVIETKEFKVKMGETPGSIASDKIKLALGKDGFATSIVVDGKERPFKIEMFKYGAAERKERSGLYLFLPDGEAVPLNPIKPFIRVVKGKMSSYVEVWINQLSHRVTLYNNVGVESHSLHISNTIDIRAEQNFELMMRIQTGIESGDISYTDLNGFQMIKRKRFDKLTLQGNYYPLPAATFIEDDTLRMTVLSKQPLGTASLSSGQIEIMMDRRLMQDDNRGAGQGGKDNLETLNSFKILFEVPTCVDKEKEDKAPMLSLLAHQSLHHLLHPLRSFNQLDPLTPSSLSGIGDYSPKSEGAGTGVVGCDIELVELTLLPSYTDKWDDESYDVRDEASITIRRLGYDGRFKNYCDTEVGKFEMNALFGSLFQDELSQCTISFLHTGQTIPASQPISMKPMEIYAFKSKLRRTTAAA